MRAALITLAGMEDIASQEIEEKIGKNGKTNPSFVFFDVKNKDELYSFVYTSQSARRVIIVSAMIEHKNEKSEAIVSKLIKEMNEKILKEEVKDSFYITCVKENYTDDHTSPDIASSLAETIQKISGAKPTLQEPNTQLVLFITRTHAVFGIDIAGFDLAKREYKIFTGSFALKAPLAYAMVRLSGFDEKKTLLDPLCGAGIIPIEAGFFATKKSVHYFEKKKFLGNYLYLFDKEDKKIKKSKSVIWAIGDSFNHIAWTKKNAKIAGIQDALHYSRTEVDYLDAKFEEKTMDCIVSYPPVLSKRANEKKMRKLYEQLFDEANFLLKKKGRLVLLAKHPEHYLVQAERVKLSLKEQRTVWQGQEELFLVVFEKP